MKLTCLGALLGALGLLACTDLASVEPDRCGNRVVERDRGEDCDRPGDTCGQPGTPAECRLLCSDASPCPTGSVCGAVDHVCRGTGDGFSATLTAGWTARNLLVGDTTGDGFPELVGAGDVAIDVRLGATDAGYRSTLSITNLTISDQPRLSDRDGDGVADLTVPVGLGIYSLLGDPVAVLDPVIQSSLPVPTDGRFVASAVPFVVQAPSQPPRPDSEVLAVLRTNTPPMVDIVILGDAGLAIPGGRRAEHAAGDEIPWAWLTSPATEIVAVAAFHDDPATPVADETAVYLFRGSPSAGTLVAAGQIALPAGYHLRVPDRPGHEMVTWMDRIDEDAAADVVIAIVGPFGEGIMVAWGNGLGGFTAPELIIGGPGPTFATADAIGWDDVDGDGRAELIGREAIYLNECRIRTTCRWIGTEGVSDRRWIAATVGDVNGDARPDLIAIGQDSVHLDVLLGTAVRGTFNDARIVADGLVEDLRTGDFDGNGVGDVAFVASTGDHTDKLYVAFGQRNGTPASPTYMGFIGDLLAWDRMNAAIPGRQDAIDDLLVASARGGARGSALLFGSTSQRLVAPLIPAVIAASRFGFVQAVLSVPMDEDDTADVAALLAEFDLTGSRDTVVYVVRVYRSAPDGSLTERTTQAVAIQPAQFELFGARWTSIPRAGATPSVLVGVDNTGRMVAVPIACTPSGCIGATQSVATPTVLGAPAALRVVDVDGDGQLDVAGAFRAASSPTAKPITRVVYWRNQGGTLGSPVEVRGPDGIDLVDVAVIDLGLDGAPDLIMLGRGTDTGGLYVAPVTGGTVGAVVAYPGSVPPDADLTRGLILEAADLDGDGLTDLALTSGPDPSSPRTVTVLTQNPALVPAPTE